MVETPSVVSARAALSDARRQRAEYLIALSEGLLEPRDVVDAAALDAGRPLRKITLRQLHLSQEGWGERRTQRLLSAVAARIGLSEEHVKGKTVAWLIDPRSGGRRYLAWLDAQQEKDGAPWAGFPFTKQGAYW